ncbi:hypothetical protein M885DRAFT_494082 [Pelagophyceae sp. CCMP2097]|nr:hypothetical protein M885DRAFT_494082 [Pelagophyceae sp. CCMP2097]
MGFTARELKRGLEERPDIARSSAVWDAVVRSVQDALATGRGISVPGLGRWTFLKTSNTGTQTLKEPRFVADESFLRAFGVAARSKVGNGLVAPSAALNLIAVARAAGVDKDEARAGLQLIVALIGQAAATESQVRLQFANVGTLSIDARVLAFKFAQGLNTASSLPHLEADSARGPESGRTTHRDDMASSRTARSFGGSVDMTARDASRSTARGTARRDEALVETSARSARTARSSPAADLYVRKYPTFQRGDALAGLTGAPALTARTLNLQQEFQKYDQALLGARASNASEDRKIALHQKQLSEVERAKQKARARALEDLDTQLRIQTEEQRQRFQAGAHSRRNAVHPDPSRAVPMGRETDFVLERKQKIALMDSLRAQQNATEAARAAALKKERAFDATNIQRASEEYSKDREMRTLIENQLKSQLESAWVSQMDYKIALAKTTNLGTIPGQR